MKQNEDPTVTHRHPYFRLHRCGGRTAAVGGVAPFVPPSIIAFGMVWLFFAGWFGDLCEHMWLFSDIAVGVGLLQF